MDTRIIYPEYGRTAFVGGLFDKTLKIDNGTGGDYMRKDGLFVIDIEKSRKLVIDCIKSVVFVLCLHVLSMLILTEIHFLLHQWSLLVLLYTLVSPLYFLVKGNSAKAWHYILMIFTAHVLIGGVCLFYLKSGHHDSDVSMYGLVIFALTIPIFYDVILQIFKIFKKDHSTSRKTSSFLVDVVKSAGYVFTVHLIVGLLCAYLCVNDLPETATIGLFIFIYMICAPLYFFAKDNTQKPLMHILITCVSHVLFSAIMLVIVNQYYDENSMAPLAYMSGQILTSCFVLGLVAFDTICIGAKKLFPLIQNT